MKIGIFFIICLVIQKDNVSSEHLPELLRNAQHQTDEFHSFITSVLLKFRLEMSNILTGIVTESLSHILKPLEELPNLNVEYTGDVVDSESERIAKQISRCSAQADNDIQAAIKQFFFVFNPIQEKSLTVLNTVLEEMVEWNNRNDPSDIVDKVHNVLETKTNEFVSTTVPSLEDELRKFKSVVFLIPSSVSRCVSDAVNN